MDATGPATRIAAVKRHALVAVTALSCVVVLVTAARAEPAGAQSTTIRLSPRVVPSAAPGSVLKFEVWLDNPVELGAFQFRIDYSPLLLEFDSVELGPLLGSTGREVIEFPVQTEDGSFTYGAASAAGSPGASVSGVLAVFRLRVLEAGQGEVRMSQVEVADTSRAPIPVENGPPARVSVHEGIYIPFATRP